MTLHYDCSIEGLEENWVEVSAVWTRKELKTLTDTTDTEDITVVQDLWKAKFVACNIVTISGRVISDAQDLTMDVLEEDLDIRLCDFLGYVLMQAGAHLRTVGPLSGRLLSDGAEETSTKA